MENLISSRSLMRINIYSAGDPAGQDTADIAVP
jgi:hypothetical protein